MLQLEALQANDGDCLLLRYGTTGKPGLILIDGGSGGVYDDFLEKRLDQLRGGKPVLNLRMVVVSHIDADHITGILDMFRGMSEAVNDGQQPRWKVGSLWHNAFEKVVGTHAPSASSATVAAAASGKDDLVQQLARCGLDDPKAIAVVASVKQGKDLQGFAKKTKTDINKETNGQLITAPEDGKKVIRIDQNLTLTILGPHEAELKKLEQEWNKSKAKHATDEKAAAADYLNRTVPNLSSTVFLAEYTEGAGSTTKMLLTGDAGGDLILGGLQSAGLLDSNKQIKVDLLKIQHHASKHSVAPDFFTQVRADKYVVSGNGKHGIPNIEVFEWLSKSRKGQPCDVYMTNRHLEDSGEDLTPGLDKFLSDEHKNEPLHNYHFRQEDALSIVVQLLDTAAFSQCRLQRTRRDSYGRPKQVVHDT